VCLSIRLVISIEIYPSRGDSTSDGGFPDGTFGRATVVFEFTYRTDVN
jgi:hypothetical protein